MIDAIKTGFRLLKLSAGKMALLLLGMSLAILLFSCASNISLPRAELEKESLLIATQLPFQLLPSDVFAQASAITQQVTMSYEGKQNTFISRIEVDSSGFVVVAMSELGQTIFTLQYRNNQLDIDKPT